MNYDQTLEYLYNRLPVFHHVGAAAYKPGLDNTINLMNALGNPHHYFKSIHVAGTNGKGSVSHMLAAIFQSAGYKTGLYTSPHLVHFGERIRVNGQMIDEQYVVDFVEDNKLLFDTVQPSFFEATMAMAFRYFADEQVDIAIVEVGLGGRLDSTNVISPLLSVITNISFDHVGFLGDTLAKIAAEKAGIIKDNTPVIVGEWLPETRPVFENKAFEMKSPLYIPDVEMIFNRYENDCMICTNSSGDTYRIGLTGDYQLKNVATVLKTIEIYNKYIAHNSEKSRSVVVSELALKNGLEYVTQITNFRGRWETIQENPKIIADTGHNVAGIKYVVQQLKQQNYEKLHIVIGMVNDKDISHVLELLPLEAEYYFTQAAVLRALPASDLKKSAELFDLKGNFYPTIKEAVETAKSKASAHDLIFVGGSNFVVGEFLLEAK